MKAELRNHSQLMKPQRCELKPPSAERVPPFAVCSPRSRRPRRIDVLLLTLSILLGAASGCGKAPQAASPPRNEFQSRRPEASSMPTVTPEEVVETSTAPAGSATSEL